MCVVDTAPPQRVELRLCVEMMTSRTEVAAIWSGPAAILVGLSALFTEDGADIRVIDGDLVKGDVRAQ